MGDQSLAEIARRLDKEQATTTAYRVLYDGQCEICQSCVSWLKALDHKKKTSRSLLLRNFQPFASPDSRNFRSFSNKASRSAARNFRPDSN